MGNKTSSPKTSCHSSFRSTLAESTETEVTNKVNEKKLTGSRSISRSTELPVESTLGLECVEDEEKSNLSLGSHRLSSHNWRNPNLTKKSTDDTNLNPNKSNSEEVLNLDKDLDLILDLDLDHGQRKSNIGPVLTKTTARVNNGFSQLREKMDLRNLDRDTKEKVKAGLFLTTISGLSILGGFGTTIALAKRQDPNNFAKGLTGAREVHESGISLATRALARGTLFSVMGVGLFCFTVWKMLGVHNLKEFRYKVGTLLPTIPKKENPGRGEFSTIRDLFQFIIDEDEKEKRAKESERKS